MKDYRGVDPIIMSTIMVILGLSLMVLYSATSKTQALGYAQQYWVRQSIWMGAGLVLMLAVSHIDYRRLGAISWIFYAIGLAFLVLVLLIGRNISGSQRWLHFAGITIQPSEFMKVIYIVTLAWYFDGVRQQKIGIVQIVVSGMIALIPFLLIVKEPDLGTALVLVPIYMMMLFAAGTALRYFVGFGILSLGMFPLVWSFFLKNYQKQRITMFMNPENDQFGAGWTIVQSKIAIGSGQFWGKGFKNGSQTQLNFLPEHHTDFIFSVIGEEWGFIGVLVLFILFLTLITRSLWIVSKTYDYFGKMIVVGVVTLLAFQLIVNVGMTFGAFPVTGLPLPFFSYGGSALVSILIGIGFILSVYRYRD
jgi:rod shape determining protein RodA